MPADAPILRPTTAADAEPLRSLRLEALRLHPTAFTADLSETERRPPEWWRSRAAGDADGRPSVIVVAEAGGGGGTSGGETGGGELVGMAGVYVPPEPKLCHGGVVWGVYVRAPFRGRGVGGRLVSACAGWARSRGLLVLKLSAVGDNAARRTYERCGFVAYGVEPMAVRWDEKLYDETLMALRL